MKLNFEEAAILAFLFGTIATGLKRGIPKLYQKYGDIVPWDIVFAVLVLVVPAFVLIGWTIFG